MESCLRLTLIGLLAVVSSAAFGESAKAAQVNVTVSPAAAEANDANWPAMPFMAEITSGDVYVRSGAGTNYYSCTKLNMGDKIKVVGSKFSWLQIVAPAGTYAWISSQYITVDPQNSTIGTVIGDAVRVYAGSDDVQPMHSTSSLVKLNKGDKVTLLGESKEGYSKISPPEGAYLWVSSQYVRPLGSLVPPQQPMPTLTPAVPPSPAAPFPAVAPPAAKTPAGDTGKPRVTSPNEPPSATTPQAAVEDPKIKELEALKAAVEAEKAKPIEQQNFSEMKKSLLPLAADKESLRISRNAQNLLNVIEKCELAQEVAKSAKLQDEQFGQTRQKIENARNAKLAEFEDLSIFAVIGQFKQFTPPSPRYYRIVDSEGKTICFAQPAEGTSQEDLSKYIDKKVGLIGTISPNTELGDAVVEFTKIIVIEK